VPNVKREKKWKSGKNVSGMTRKNVIALRLTILNTPWASNIKSGSKKEKSTGFTGSGAGCGSQAVDGVEFVHGELNPWYTIECMCITPWERKMP